MKKAPILQALQEALLSQVERISQQLARNREAALGNLLKAGFFLEELLVEEGPNQQWSIRVTPTNCQLSSLERY